MKYVFMFASDPSLQAGVDPEVARAVYAKIYAWFGEHAAEIADGGAELLGVETATTVRSGGSVADGPFSEAKEVIGGFTIVDVADLDAAVALAKTWPSLELPGNSIEIRPMVVDYSQFE